MRGTRLAASFGVTNRPDDFVIKECINIVIPGTRIACPIKRINKLIFPRPIARNPTKLISNRGRDANANSIVLRTAASTDIPI